MATVYQRVGGSGKQSKFWHMAIYVPAADGKKKLLRKSTGFTDRKKALAAAVELERAGRIAGEGRLTRARTLESLARVLELATGEKPLEHTADSWFRGWLEIKRANASPSTLIRYTKTVESFLAFVGSLAHRPLDFIGTSELVAFQALERARGKAPHSVNLDLKILGQALSAAVKRGILRDSPFAAVEKVSGSGHAKRLPFTETEVGALVAAASGEWRGVIIMGAWTGARLGDVVRLRWGAVNHKDWLITISPEKTKHARMSRTVVVPVLPPLRAWAEEQGRGHGGTAFVFPGLAPKAVSGKSGLSMAFAKIMREAGIEAGEARAAEGEAGRKVSEKSFHSLRHFFNSRLVNAGVSQEVRQRMLGHSSARMNNVYSHWEPAALHAAVAAVCPLGPSKEVNE